MKHHTHTIDPKSITGYLSGTEISHALNISASFFRDLVKEDLFVKKSEGRYAKYKVRDAYECIERITKGPIRKCTSCEKEFRSIRPSDHCSHDCARWPPGSMSKVLYGKCFVCDRAIIKGYSSHKRWICHRSECSITLQSLIKEGKCVIMHKGRPSMVLTRCITCDTPVKRTRKTNGMYRAMKFCSTLCRFIKRCESDNHRVSIVSPIEYVSCIGCGKLIVSDSRRNYKKKACGSIECLAALKRVNGVERDNRLTEGIVRHRIVTALSYEGKKIRSKDVPQSLVDAKRSQLMVARLVKSILIEELNHENT